MGEQVLGIKPWMVRQLFSLIDMDESDRLERSEFILGCMRLSGPAKNMDIHTMIKNLRQVAVNTDKIKHMLEYSERARARMHRSLESAQPGAVKLVKPRRERVVVRL